MFHDGAARAQPKLVRPHPPCGHPEASALLEATFTDIMKNQGWTAIPSNGSVFLHGTSRARIMVYVDDTLLLTKPKDIGFLWRTLEKAIHFKDPEMPLTRYLGARPST